MGGEPIDESQLYDAYLDAAMQGEAENPSAYLRRHGVEDASLLDSLKAAQQLVDDGRLLEQETIADQRLGDYRLVKRLGKGGMGIVFLAEQVSLHRLVALKVIRPDMQASAHAKERFIREARAVARLRHPHIVTVFDFGEDRDMLYIAMELVPGKGLDDLLHDLEGRGPLPVEQVLRWLVPIVEAVHVAHEQGIIHRDIKPSNVIISKEGVPILLDFGLARESLSEQSTITMSFIGTPTYASPEQLIPGEGKLDRRTDIYSLGVMLYRCLSGQLPFDIKLSADSIEKFLANDAPPVRGLRPELSRELEAVVHKALAKDPDARYPDAAALAHDLRALLEHRPIASSRSTELRLADALERALPGCAIDEFLCPGSHGKIFRGRFPGQQGDVAIKLMDAWIAENAADKFLLEAERAARVDHPHVANVLACGHDGGCCYVVSQLHAGTDLQRLVEEQGPLPLEEALSLVRRVGLGLHAVHEADTLHRDVKPGNIYVDLDTEEVMLIDFGLSADLAHGQAVAQAQAGFGTPAVMAPEVCLGQTAGTASDQYALAVTLFFLLSGRFPFTDPSPLALLQMHIHQPPPPLPPHVPRQVSRAVGRALAKKPGGRFDDVLGFITALDAPPPPAGPPRERLLWLVLPGVLVLLAVAWWIWG